MDVGRDLTVTSLQDTMTQSGSSWDAGLSVGFGILDQFPADWLGTDPNGTKTFVGRPIVGGNGNGLSLDVGTSSGSMAWVNGQTSIIGQHDVDIYYYITHKTSFSV